MKRGIHDPTLYDYVESEHIAREYDSYHSGNRLFDLDEGFVSEVMPSGGKVLDIGCGTGRMMIYLRDRGYEVVGVDLSEHMLEVAREKIGGDAVLVRADMLELPFADESMDGCLMMFSVLGMLKGESLWLKALGEAARVLKRGGILALHVHNRYKHLFSGAMGILKSAVSGLFSGTGEIMRGYHSLPGLYLHLFSRGETRRLLEESGFDVTRVESIAPDRSGFMRTGGLSWGADGFLFAGTKKG